MAMTKRNRAIQLSKLQATCDAWNAKYPIGTPVMLKEDFCDEPAPTTTRSTAQVLSGHSAVVWLTGVSGCYHLTHVRAATTPEEQAAASADLKAKLVNA